jgi:hypothetical protein
MDALLEWAALVCFLSGRPLENFASSFANHEPFHCIIGFYFPRRGKAGFFESQNSLSLLSLPPCLTGTLGNIIAAD